MTPAIPHSKASEEALLGAVLIDPECFPDLAQFVGASDFYVHRNAWVWDAFRDLRERGEPIDVLTTIKALEACGQLAEIGGPAYLTALITQTPSSLNAEAYGRIVKQNAIRREMLAAANRLATSAYDMDLQTDKALVDTEREIDRLLSATAGHEVGHIAPIISSVYDRIKERSEHPAEMWGIPTGLPKFDKCTGGQHAGEMTFLAGEPGLGKTWLSLGMAVEMAKHSPGAFFSLEMRSEQIVRRLISGFGSIPARNMRTGYMDESDWIKLAKAVDGLEALPFYLDDRARDTAGLRAALLRLKREAGVEWFVLDYMQLLADDGRDDNERTKKIGRELKHICADLELAGLVINSVNKQGMDRRGDEAHSKSYMSGSGQNIHDADLVLFLTEYTKEKNDLSYISPEDMKRMATLWVKKGRELEDPRVRVNLVRRMNSPFWGEMKEK